MDRTGRSRASARLMKGYKSRARVDTGQAPRWWLSGPEQVEAYLRSLKGVTVFEIGRSAGGRPILAAARGRRERVGGRTSESLSSALAGGSAAAFYGSRARQRQVLLFIGGVHGTENEGTVAALNLLNVAVTGKDLRGRRHPRMAREARKLRIVIIPFLNMDGRCRFADRLHFVGVDTDPYMRMSQGALKGGRRLDWPTSKLLYPLPLDEVAGTLGSYYNDAGYNLVYDHGFGGDCQPETRALVALAREERPDCAVLSHSNNGSLVQPPGSFIPRRFRQRQVQIGAVVGARCRRDGLAKSQVPTGTETYAGQVFYQSDLMYHCCGALPLLVEFPWGYQNVPDNHGEILDIGLAVLEEIVAFGTAYGFRPPEK